MFSSTTAEFDIKAEESISEEGKVISGVGRVAEIAALAIAGGGKIGGKNEGIDSLDGISIEEGIIKLGGGKPKECGGWKPGCICKG